MNVFEYEYETEDEEKKKRTVRFLWVSSLELTKRNLEEMILAGRGRWKIENEGFNNQKNGLYRIGHLNSNALKNHYLLTQISDILMQLYLAWNPYIREVKQTIKNTSKEQDLCDLQVLFLLYNYQTPGQVVQRKYLATGANKFFIRRLTNDRDMRYTKKAEFEISVCVTGYMGILQRIPQFLFDSEKIQNACHRQPFCILRHEK